MSEPAADDEKTRAQRVLALRPSSDEVYDGDGAPDLTDASPRYAREIARGYTHEAYDALAAIMRNPSSTDTARIACAKELLRRGWGEPGSEAEMLKVFLEAHAGNQEAIRFVMPMSVDGAAPPLGLDNDAG